MGEHAECVMLNKGPYIVSAVKALDDILKRMQTHQEKKRAMLRRLRIASCFVMAGGARSGSDQVTTNTEHGAIRFTDYVR
jgi:hypothetical protein